MALSQNSKVKRQKYRIKVKSSALVIVCSVFLAWMAGVAAADVFTSNDLIRDAEKWDGDKVVYAGEAVTAVMVRGRYAWVNLNDGDNAIGVWGQARLLQKITYCGDYKNKGDIVEVIGRFHRACPMHGGDMDIHAYSVTIEKKGHQVAEAVDMRRNRLSAGAFLLLAMTVYIFRKRT